MPRGRDRCHAMTRVCDYRIPGADLSVSCLVQGDPEGSPPIVFLHSNVGTKNWWLPLFEVLPEDMRLYASDLRGCGDTLHRSGTIDLFTLLQDLRGLVDVLQLTSFVLVAHSTSCPIALEFGLRFGHLLQGLVLVGSPPLSGISTPPEGFRLLQQALRDDRLARQMMNLLLPCLDATRQNDRDFLENAVESLGRLSPRALDQHTRILETWNCQDRISGLVPPLLLIRGEEDAVTSHDMALKTLLSIPGANNLEVIRGAGHAPMVENPVAFAVRLIDFVYQEFEQPAAPGPDF